MTTEYSEIQSRMRGRIPPDDAIQGTGARSRAREALRKRFPARQVKVDIATVLGVVSVGIGVAALLAPRTLGRATGLYNPMANPVGNAALLRAVGLRELASGVGLLTQRRAEPWLWSRVAGDAMDLALLGTALRPTNPGRDRAMRTMAAVAGIAAVDVTASLRERSRRREAPYARREAEALVEHTVSVNKTPSECYTFWRDVSNLSKFSPMLESVTPIDERRSHWVLRGPAGLRSEWDSEITVDRPGEQLAWLSLQGSSVKHAGTVRFDAAPGGRGTFVSVMMHYHVPGGRLTSGVAKLLGKDPGRLMREDLRRFKNLIETGEVPTTRGQPSGKRSFLGRLTRDGRQSNEGGIE